MKNSIKYLYTMKGWVDNMKYTVTSKLFKEIYKAFVNYVRPYCVTMDYLTYDDQTDSFGIAFMINTEDYNENEKLIRDFISLYQLNKYLEISNILHIKAQKYFQTTLKIKLTKIGQRHKKDLISLLLLREN